MPPVRVKHYLAKMVVSLKESIEEKYSEKDHESEEFGLILFVSCSPEAKIGMFPPLMTLNDFNIECFGTSVIFQARSDTLESWI